MKALIFDMDDTLVNSSPLHKESFRQCFLKYGVDINEVPTEVEKTFFGRTHKEITKLLIDYFELDLKVETILKERKRIISDLLKEVEPMPGLDELINFLKNYGGKKAIATSSLKRYAEIILNKLKIKGLFDAVVTAEDIKKSKPDPEIFLKTAEKLEISPENCIVIEDSKNGILAAKACKMGSFGVRNSKFDTHQDLGSADVVLNDLGEIKEAVQKEISLK